MIIMKLLDLTDKTIAQLVRETGISRSTLVDIIKGNTEFKSTSVENGMKISEALNLTIEELYNKIYNLKEEK
ncbi:XRE family transcriptional regulator [Coprobacillus sp. OM08-19]|jgi:transcriptional regulator with XRE-family HTH domain|nr:XRE family transcriptional regulator [Coprobacillus sp. OM08-19]RHU61834.1 XRE family transcriptional regulator [Coprobacillus sp. TF10-10]